MIVEVELVMVGHLSWLVTIFWFKLISILSVVSIALIGASLSDISIIKFWFDRVTLLTEAWEVAWV